MCPQIWLLPSHSATGCEVFLLGLQKGTPTCLLCPDYPFRLVHSDFRFLSPGRQVVSDQSFWNVCRLAPHTRLSSSRGVGSGRVPLGGEGLGGGCALVTPTLSHLLLCVLHSLRLPPRGRRWQDVQPDHGPVSLQGRRDRHYLQPLRQGLPAEPLTHRPLHKYAGRPSFWPRGGSGSPMSGGQYSLRWIFALTGALCETPKPMEVSAEPAHPWLCSDSLLLPGCQRKHVHLFPYPPWPWAWAGSEVWIRGCCCGNSRPLCPGRFRAERTDSRWGPVAFRKNGSISEGSRGSCRLVVSPLVAGTWGEIRGGSGPWLGRALTC